jgi:AcrR family transcriptional regulator
MVVHEGCMRWATGRTGHDLDGSGGNAAPTAFGTRPGTKSMSITRTRMRAPDRREVVIRAGVREFGRHGYAGTTAQSIAAHVGVSQPYLFELFGTKKSMFIAVVQHGFERCRAAFEASAKAAGARAPDEILEAMGRTYADLLVDGDLLRLQLQAYAACDDPEIRAVVRQEWTKLYGAVARWSGADDAALRAWFAEGMLLNVAAGVGDLSPLASPLRASLPMPTAVTRTHADQGHRLPSAP